MHIEARPAWRSTWSARAFWVAALLGLAGARAPAAGATINSPAAPPAAASAAQVRTLLQGWYLADELAPDGFRIRRANIWITGEAAPGLGYLVLLNPVRALAPPTIVTDPARPGAWSARSGGDDKIVLDAFGRFEHGGWSLQAGQFRIPLSAEALEAGADLVTIRRALFNESATQVGLWRDIGLMGRGRPWPWLDLACGVFNGEGMNVAEGDHRKDLVARLVVEPAADVAIGLAHQERAFGPSGPDHRRTGLSLDVPLGPLAGRAEALWGMDGGTTKLGWFVQVSGFMRPELQLVARYEAWDPDQARARVQRDLTLGLNGYPGPLWGVPASNGAKLALNLVHQAGPAGSGLAGLLMWQVMR